MLMPLLVQERGLPLVSDEIKFSLRHLGTPNTRGRFFQSILGELVLSQYQ